MANVKTPTDPEIRRRLQRLWKGTLFIGVAGVYVALLASALILFGWQPALLAAFLILLGQCFRYVANDIDRLGWAMANATQGTGQGDGAFDAATKRDQRRLFRLLGGLVLLTDLALAAEAYVLADWQGTMLASVALAFVEWLYVGIRRVNRRISFVEASYGLRDRSLLGRGPDTNRAVSVEQRLDRLKAMADVGEISQRAYEKARDKHRVDIVMRDEG